MMSDERRRRWSPESSRRSRRKARRDERERPASTLYSYPSQSHQAHHHQSQQWAAHSPLPPISMRSNDDARAAPITTTTTSSALPMAMPVPSDLNRPQRPRRRSRHGSGSSSDFTYSSSGSSSSSYLDISRWYPSYGRAGGVLNAFFKTPSEHRPRRRRSKRQVRTKKTKAIFSFGNNSSSSSVNSDMAYGMGFVKKSKSRAGDSSRGYGTAATTAAVAAAAAAGVAGMATASTMMAKEASGSRPGLQRRQTDEEILEIGRKLAKVAQEQKEEDLRRMGKKPPSRSHRRHGYSSDDESEWESASEDESSDESSDGGLAYGFHPVATSKPPSRPSTMMAPASPKYRRGPETKSPIIGSRSFGPVNSLQDYAHTPYGFDHGRGSYSAAGPSNERYTTSAASATAEARPLQTLYPIGTSDPGRMEAARDSGSVITLQQNNYTTVDDRDRIYSTISTSNDRPDPVPIQAPKPIAPVPSRMYDEQRVHDPEPSDSRGRQRRSSEYRDERSTSRPRRDQSADHDYGRSDSRERHRKSKDSSIFAETALVGAGVAALGAAMMAKRDKGKGKETEVTHGRDERYGHDDHRQDDTKVQDSRRAKELALEREIERLEQALAGRNKARENRKRESKRNTAPADLGRGYEREETRRSERSGADDDAQLDSRTRDSGHGSTVDVFQYQVPDDAFDVGTAPSQPPEIIDVTPAPSPTPEQERKSRRDSLEDEMRDARHIIEEASHSTAPIPEVAMAAAIAATEHSRHQEERGDEGRGRASSRTEQDRVLEEANRYYHARRIAEREIRSRSRSQSSDREREPPRIVTPPEMKDQPKVYDYSKPNADIVFDNELSPTELRFFLPSGELVRDPSAQRPRPLLNLILPTPVPTPSLEKVEQKRTSATRDPEALEESTNEAPTVILGPKGDIVHIVGAPEPREEIPQPQTPKSVSWGPSETKSYEVWSPARSRERTPESPEQASRPSKRSSGSGWGAVAAALAGVTAGAAIAQNDHKERSEGSRSPPKERPILPAGTSSRVLEEEPEELPPLPGPKPASPRSSQMPGAFGDDLEFTANVAAGLAHAGFPTDIVVEDPNFRRRDSPPGSNEPFVGIYTQPFSETVSDLGVFGNVDGSRPVREPGYVLGEVAETPASEKAAAFEEPSSEPPKLSKKEQRKLKQAAKAAKSAEKEQKQARPFSFEYGDDDWADVSSPSRASKKSQKSKRSSVTWDDEDTPVDDFRDSGPIETVAESKETEPWDKDDDWNEPRHFQKSNRNSKSSEPANDSSSDREEGRRDAYEALTGSITPVRSDSRYDDKSNGPGIDDNRSVASAPSSSDRKRESKSEKRGSAGSSFWGLLKGSNGAGSSDKESKKDDAGTLGAGAGLAGAAVAAVALAGGIAAARSDAAEAPSGQEEPHVGRDVEPQPARRADSPSRKIDVFEDPEIAPRVIKPAIDPQYGDLLPLPPSPGERSPPEPADEEDLPALPDSRPATPPGQERTPIRKRSSSSQRRPVLAGHARRSSTHEPPPRSPSHTAVPLLFRMGQRPMSAISPAGGRSVSYGSPSIGRSSPTAQSPVTSSGHDFSPPLKRSSRPTSWDNNKEFKPLYLLEHTGRIPREVDEDLDESPEKMPLPPSRESPAPDTEFETTVRQEVDNPLYIDTEATRAVPPGSQQSTPKGTPAAEYTQLVPAEDTELTPFETPLDAPFADPSTTSLPESSYVTPVESPTETLERAPVAVDQDVGQSVEFPHDSVWELHPSSQAQETIPEERKSQEGPEVQQKKSYFPSAFSILPAATLAGVGALLGRGKRDDTVKDPAEHTASTDPEEQHEQLPALADALSVEADARGTALGDQSGFTEQGAADAGKSPADTPYSSATDAADASVPNDHAAAAPTRPEDFPLPVDEPWSSDDVVDHSGDSQIPTVAELSDIPLPPSPSQDIEEHSNITTPSESEQRTTTEDMETIVETPADTIDWPVETVSKKKKGKKGKKKQSISNAPQVPVDAEITSSALTDIQGDELVPEASSPVAVDEPAVDTESASTPNVPQAEAETAHLVSAPGDEGTHTTELNDFEEVSDPSRQIESAEALDLFGQPEEPHASTEVPASTIAYDDQGATTGERPLKSSSGRRLRSSRVLSPHGSMDGYMSSDAIQSGDDAPSSPASGFRATGKKYKKTRSLRSSRRSSAASQASVQGDVTAERIVPGEFGESTAPVPHVEHFRDADEEAVTSAPAVADQPADAQIANADQYLSQEPGSVEEPAANEAAAVNPDTWQDEPEAGVEADNASFVPGETQALLESEVAAEPVTTDHQTGAQVDDESSQFASEEIQDKQPQSSINLAEIPSDLPIPSAVTEEAVTNAAEPSVQLETTPMIPTDDDQARGAVTEQLAGEEQSQFQTGSVGVTATAGDGEQLPADDVLPQGQSEIVLPAENSVVTEPRDLTPSPEDEPAFAQIETSRDETSTEQSIMPLSVDEPPVNATEDQPTTQDPEPEPTAVSIEEEFPVASTRKSKKSKKKRKGSAVLDEAVQSSGTATPAEFEQAGEDAGMQETSKSPVLEEASQPAAEVLDDATAAKEDHQAIEDSADSQVKEAEDVLAPSLDPAATQPDTLEDSEPIVSEVVGKDLAEESAKDIQPAESGTDSVLLDPATVQASSFQADEPVEVQTGAVEMPQPTEYVEQKEDPVATDAAAEKLEAAEAPAPEEAQPVVSEEDIVRREAEAAKAEGDEKEIARLQSKKKLKPKEKQRLRQLKAKSEERAALAEAIATALAEEKAPLEATPETEVITMPSEEATLLMEGSPEAGVEENPTPEEIAVDSQPIDAIAPTSSMEEATPALAEDPSVVDQNLSETTIAPAQQSEPGPFPDTLLEDVHAPIPEQKDDEADTAPEPIADAVEDLEEITRREAEATAIRQEELELSRLENKKKPNKKDKQRMKTLRASAELRERESEALKQQIEEHEATAAAAAQEPLGTTPVETEAVINEKSAPTEEASEPVPAVEDVLTRPEEYTKPEVDMPTLSQTDEQLSNEVENTGQNDLAVDTETPPKDKIAANAEGVTKDDIEEAPLDQTNVKTLEAVNNAPETIAEESVPLPDHAARDADDSSLRDTTDFHVTQDPAMQNAGDLSDSSPQQDQSQTPGDQTEMDESTRQIKGEAEVVQDDLAHQLPEDTITLPDYQQGEAEQSGDKPETEIMAEQGDLPPTKPDDSQTLPEGETEQPTREITQLEAEGTVTPPLEPSTRATEEIEPVVEPLTDEPVPEPLSVAIPTSESQDPEPHVETREETSAIVISPTAAEAEPISKTKKSKKDKKKRKGTLSGSSTSGIVTPAETSEPAAATAAVDAILTPEVLDTEIEPPQQSDQNSSQQLESTASPNDAAKESPILQAQEPANDAQEANVPLSELDLTGLPAVAENEATPAVEPDAEQEVSPQQPEFTISRKKSKKDKKKGRKGTISEPSPQASEPTTPAESQVLQQEATSELSDKPEGPAPNVESETTPIAAADIPEERETLKQETRDLPSGAEGAAAVEASEDFQVSVPTEDTSMLPTHEQPDNTNEPTDNGALGGNQRFETEQANVDQEQAESSTIVEDVNPADLAVVAETETTGALDDATTQVEESPKDLNLEGGSVLPTAAESQETEADELSAVPANQSKAMLETESGAQTPAIEAPIEPVTHDMTEISTNAQDPQEPPTVSPGQRADEPAKDSPTPKDDWAPATSSKTGKKKKNRPSVSLWESEGESQTLSSEESQQLQDTPEPTTATTEQKDTTLATQPTETILRDPEDSSSREVVDTQDIPTLPAFPEVTSEKRLEPSTDSVKHASATPKSGAGWGLIAAALGSDSSEPKKIDDPTLPVEPVESETEPVVSSTELLDSPPKDLTTDSAPATTESADKEPQPVVGSFNEPEAPVTKSMGGWSTIAAAVAGATAGGAAVPVDKSHRGTSPQRALDDVVPASEPIAKSSLDDQVTDGDETLIVAGGEPAKVDEDTAKEPLPKPEPEDKVQDGEDTLIVEGGKASSQDIEPWSFEATRDIQTEPIIKPELDEKVDDGDDAVVVAGEQTAEEPMQVPATEDTGDNVVEQANDFLGVDRAEVRPSSPVPWEDGDRMDDFATPSEQPPVQAEEEKATASPSQGASENLEFFSGTKSKKDKKKKKKGGSASQSADYGSEVPTSNIEDTNVEGALDEQQPPASTETQELAEQVQSRDSRSTDKEAEAFDWTPKKMSKKEKRKAKKGSLSIPEPEPISAVPEDSQQVAEAEPSLQDAAESAKQLSSLHDNPDAPVDEALRDLPMTEEPQAIAASEPADEEHSLDAETSTTQQLEPVYPLQPDDTKDNAPVLESAVEPREDTEPTSQDEPVSEKAPILTRKMSKKEKRKAKKAASAWEDEIVEPTMTAAVATEDTQTLDTTDPVVEPEPTQDATQDLSSSADITQSAHIQPSESTGPVEEETLASDEWAPLSRKKSKKDKKKKGKQQAPDAVAEAQTSVVEEQAMSALPGAAEASSVEPTVPEIPEQSQEDQRQSAGDAPELAPEPVVHTKSVEEEHLDSLAEPEQMGPSVIAGIDDWEEPPTRAEPTGTGLGSPTGLGAELQKMPSAAPSPDIWDNEDYFRPRDPTDSRNSPNEKPIGKVDIHPAFSRELGGGPAKRSEDERPLVGLGLIHRHSSIFQDDDRHPPKLLTLGADNFSVESLAVEDAGSSDGFSQTGLSNAFGKQPEATSGHILSKQQRASPAPLDHGNSSTGNMYPSPRSNKAAVSHVNASEPGPTDSFSSQAPKPPPSPGLDDVNKMNKKGSVAALAERFGGSKKATGKRNKVSQYMDGRTGQDDVFDEPTMWEGSEVIAEPDMDAGQGAATSYGQETKAGADNVSATHSPRSREAGEFTPQVPEQASRPDEVPLESLVVESPILGSQASFEQSPRPAQTEIEPFDRPPDIDTGQTASPPTIATALTPDGSGNAHGLHTPQSLSPASDRGSRLNRAVSPTIEADDYAAQQGISPVSDYRPSVSRGLPPVREEPHEEEGEAGKHGSLLSTGARSPDANRDSGFVTGSPVPRPSHLFADFQQQRDSGVHLRDGPRTSPRLSGAPVLKAREAAPATAQPQKSESPARRARKHYPDLGPEAAAASLAGGAALLSGRSLSEQADKTEAATAQQRRAVSNTSISRAKTPEPLSLGPESPGALRYSGTPPLLRSRRTRSGDLRTLSQLSNRSHSDISSSARPPPAPSPSPKSAPRPASSSTSPPPSASHTPLANEGRVRSKDMADVYDGFGEGRLGSPRSPTRPHSMRRRQSMQVLELESRVEQLIAENRALSEARLLAEQHSANRATSTIAERDNEIESLKQSLDFMRKEIQRLTEVNEGLNSAIAQSAVQHEDRYRILENQHADATRELHVFRGRHSSSSQTIAEKDAEIRDLRQQLDDTKEQIREMQRQILASKPADSDFLRIKDVDYFDHRCQQLCSHVQQWVLRFSKFSDMRACRLTSELNDEKIIDRLDNAVLDGSNVDNYLNDRVRRRDIFMSLAMTMIWEFVFTRYLFGMDREQRQKLKALEKLLLEVGPPHAVRQWRAVTLTLLSRRDSFKTQRDQDTEAVVQAVFQTLSMILPPPSNLEDQIQNQLRKVMREAVDLSIEMRTQRAEYMMLPPLQPEYDANGELAEPHPFNATLMNERSGDQAADHDDLQAQGAIVRVVLFPLVVKKGDDDGVGDDEVVVCPAQVIVARPRSSSRRSMRAPSSEAGAVSLLRGGGSPSTNPNRSNVSMAEAEYLEGGI